MKRLLLVLVALLSIVGNIIAHAQDNELQKFVGVWTTGTNGGRIGNIKISIKEGKLFVQMKMDNIVRRFDNVTINEDTISWSYIEKKNHGQWYLGSWWETNQTEILVTHSDGSVGSNGVPTEVFVRGQYANIEIEYWGFRGVLNDDELQISSKCWGDYYFDNTKVFSQSSNWVRESTYTNW